MTFPLFFNFETPVKILRGWNLLDTLLTSHLVSQSVTVQLNDKQILCHDVKCDKMQIVNYDCFNIINMLVWINF